MSTLRLFRYASVALLGLAPLLAAADDASLGEASSFESKPPAVGTDPASDRHFVLRVLPILSAKCFSCHGSDPEDVQGGLDLTSREGLMRGGDTGDASIHAGRPDKSLLMEAIRWEGFEMPPKENDRLTAEQIADVEQWIASGARWPDEAQQTTIRAAARTEVENEDGVLVTTSGGLSDEWTDRRYRPEDLWAYQPIERPPLDGAQDLNKNPIDALLDRGLSKADLEAAPVAPPRQLIRRLTFDLTGLPPTPDEVARFVEAWENDSDAAWRAAIDRLLASPHYGEQAARHWLDVVRYADSSGFAVDWQRPNAWRYRDYVIRSFNNDKPYDRFLIEQIAGDELDADNPEMTIATGFLRMGPWEHTSMTVAKVARQQYLDDVTDAVGQVFLGHALQCARCHDHKFDPVPTRDYYAMQSVFATTQLGDLDAAWLPEENRTGMERDRRFHKQQQEWNEGVFQAIEKRAKQEEAKWFRERGLPYKTRKEAQEAGLGIEEIPENRIGLSPDDLGTQRVSRIWRMRHAWQALRYQPVALSVYTGKTNLPKGFYGRMRPPADPMAKGELEQTAILAGGDPYAPTEPTPPAVLSAVPGGLEFEIPEDPGGRRLALARWMAQPDNPLTPRVIVNRIWQTHFGRGLVGSPNNFGATGKKPTHPELLDYLASRFVQEGWSIKRLRRLILTSEAYRRSTRHGSPERLAEADPAEELYATFRPRRLTAEELRDAMLAVSGELNRQRGGIPARPDINLEAAMQPRLAMGTFAPAYVPNALPEQRNRRTIYTMKLRGLRDPFMEVFNQPSPDISCELRDQSNVTPQVFSLLNGQETLERSLALAKLVLSRAEDEAAAVRTLFLLAYSREPTPEELAGSLDHWREQERVQSGAGYEPIEYPTLITRKANEENSGRPFKLTERLFEYDEYVPDLEPHAVDAYTRAFADICLAVLNSNEFVYVY